VAPLYEHGAIVGLVITAIDSSTQTQLEERLAGLQRAEGLRTLTAGVVHNFNNALQRIIGQAALIKNHPDRVDIVSIASQTIIDIVGRTSDLSRQLFVIEEGTTPARVPIDLNVATLTAINRIKDLFSSPTTIGVAFGHTPSVLARHEPLVDAIEHLIQTMRRTAAPRGHLHIKTFEGETTPPSPQLGVHLVLAFDPAQPRSDSRTSDQPRIVPTLDEKLLSILGDFSATLSEHTTESGSHLLTLSFPLTHGTSVRSDPTLRLDRPDILVVDDDRMVLETVGAILTDLGFRPVITSRGEEVDALVERFGHSLKVAIIDAIMPGTDGATIIRRLRSQAPHLIAVGFSGAPPHSTSDLEAAGAVAILRKPIDPVTLCAEITRLIGTPVAP
jgi:CheY-like chemotaxis protein